MQIIDELHDAILEGQEDRAADLTRDALASGIDVQVIIDDAMVPAMAEAGRAFEAEEYFVPELLMAGRAMTAAMEHLRPLLAETDAPRAGKVVICTVQGDLHDIGKNLVAAMLEGGGFEIIDLGTDVSPEQMVAAIEEHEPDLVGLSALLTVTMPSMSRIIDAIVAAGQRDRVQVMVGGAPVTEDVAKEYGADAYADNANAAVRTALELVDI
jgi:5-methyltetrahydrofolate--homocysteine methyltransferase